MVAPANNAIVASFLFALEVVRVWVVDFIRVAIVGFLRGGREREREERLKSGREVIGRSPHILFFIFYFFALLVSYSGFYL